MKYLLDIFLHYISFHEELIRSKAGKQASIMKQDSLLGTEVNVVDDTLLEGDEDVEKSLTRSASTDPTVKAATPSKSDDQISPLRRIQSSPMPLGDDKKLAARPSFVLKHILESNVIQDELNLATEMIRNTESPVHLYLNKLKEGAVPSPESSKFRVRRLTYAQRTVEDPEPVAPLTRKRTTIYTAREPDEIEDPENSLTKAGKSLLDKKEPPFSSEILGTYSQHGVEPSNSSYEDEEKGTDEDIDSTVDKINQDRGCVCYPLRKDKTNETLLMVLDGHGEHGDRVSEYVMRQIVKCMKSSTTLDSDPATALVDAFVKSHGSLLTEGSKVQSMTSGTTCAAVYFRGDDFWTAHAGDSRVVVATDMGEEIPTARSLTNDHKPDDENERKRIEEWGGFVSPSPEPGVSARVWLDPEFTMIGLAMSRSLGDYAVTAVGVIPQPDVTQYKVEERDKFMILASDGVWEFIESQEAVEIVHLNIEKGAEEACKVLIDTATERWKEEEGDYRDDITAIVVKLPLPIHAED